MHHTPTTKSQRPYTTIHATATASDMGTAIAAPVPQRGQDHSTLPQHITYSLVHLGISTGQDQVSGKRVHRRGVTIRARVWGVVGVVRVRGGLMRRRLCIWDEVRDGGLSRIVSAEWIELGALRIYRPRREWHVRSWIVSIVLPLPLMHGMSYYCAGDLRSSDDGCHIRESIENSFDKLDEF